MTTSALPRLIAILVLLAAIGGALWLAGERPAFAQYIIWHILTYDRGVDYDDDDDGLIDIRTIAELNAIRYDLNGDGIGVSNRDAYLGAFPGAHPGMGCPGDRCHGYELRANLTATGIWEPIGIGTAYEAILEGNGHTISGINTGARAGLAGLFARLSSSSVVRNLGLISPTVHANTANDAAGGLAGQLEGRIYNSYVQGGTVTISDNFSFAGGLAGNVAATGRIESSWASAAVTVTGTPSIPRAGGLAGTAPVGASVVASYATGAVTGSGSFVRGLVGNPGANTIIDSYCATTTGQSGCRTVSALQTPTDYTGIYANWNLDLDGNGAADFPWDFGTTSTYPTLNSPERQLALSPLVDYDVNDNGLIDVGSIAQLSALRHDLDGNGIPASNSTATAAYTAAFPSRSLTQGGRMGCPGGACAGYELTASLTFPSETSSPYNPWTPISGTTTAIFNGNGHTLTNLRIISNNNSYTGLFRELGNGGQIWDVGLINPNVTTTHAEDTGALVGRMSPGSRVNSSYVLGGSVVSNHGEPDLGGLVGANYNGAIRASYSTARVQLNAAAVFPGLGGLVGWLRDSGTITASYAAGPVVGSHAQAWFGGLVGYVSHGGAIADSYCDTTVSTRSDCVGGNSNSPGVMDATATTTAVMQAPTGYTGIYADWNIDLADDFDVDFPWNFGTSSDYPTLNTPAQRLALKPPRIDYDVNDNGLIDISSIAQLDAMRHDLNGDGIPTAAGYVAGFPDRHTTAADRMGCPEGRCTGYELMANLTFGATSTWTPIAPEGSWYSGVFSGNGRTITGLNVNSSDRGAGLFSHVAAGGVVIDLGLINPEVRAAAGFGVGALTARVGLNGAVYGSYVAGGTSTLTAGLQDVGGLAGLVEGTIRASYATAVVTSSAACLSSPGCNNVRTGVLAGKVEAGVIAASYSAGANHVSGGTGAHHGGFVGEVTGNAARITDSYCDTTVRVVTNCVSHRSSGASAANTPVTGQTTAQLQAPTGYEGIYANWIIDLGDDGAPDYLWNFGTTTTYPVLNSPAQRLAAVPAPVDYDVNDNGLIDLGSNAQLDAIRHDPNGDGRPDAAGFSAYSLAFPGRPTADGAIMGCPTGTCAGYELTADLAFAATSTWAPVSTFNATLDGAGHSITGINVNVAAGDAGMFGDLGANARIRDVGLVDFSVTSTRTGAGSNGILAGYVPNTGVVISGVSVRGGRIAASTNGGNSSVGGLAGHFRGTIRASYATAAVTMTGSATNRHAGGLLGTCTGCTIIASYAAGPVTSTAALNNIGGLTGNVHGTAAVITDSYCDTQATGQSDCDGNPTGSATATSTGYTTAQLRTPTDYAGIYASWNVDLDGDSSVDYPWNFGASNQYPRLLAPAQRLAVVPGNNDYDLNDNGLIDISTRAQLDAMRYDLDGDGEPANPAGYGVAFPNRNTTSSELMGCPMGTCAGYELTADLVFAATSSWTPIVNFATTLDGAGHTITGINVNVTTRLDAAFIGNLTASSTIRDLGLINFNMTSTSPGAQSNGILSGFVAAGAVISNVYAEGGSIRIETNNTSTNVGGLVGNFRGTLTASYSTAAVTMTGNNANRYAGGLAGRCISCTITASYAAGAVTSTQAALTNIGGLTGNVENSPSTITNSYCDTEGTGQSDCDGNVVSPATASAAGHTTAQMQNPTGYTGIYSHWNLDLDADFFPDYPWNFGGASDYPRLNTPAQRLAAAPDPMDYDVNDNGLIDIASLAHLDAMRYDVNGDGIPESATTTYNAAFTGRSGAALTRMGCPMGACTGYELTMSLTFPAETSSPYTPWTPIDEYAGEFDGAGYTLTDLNVNMASDHAGLFGRLDGTVRDVGLITPDVTLTGDTTRGVGGLVGTIRTGGQVLSSYVSGGRITLGGADNRGGGLVGNNGGFIRASYATAAVRTDGTRNNVEIGGLMGRLTGEVIASYAAGPVAATGTGIDIGGLVGQSTGASAAITDSVCDTAASGQSNCVGAQSGNTVAAAGYDTAGLQTPTGYEGPYVHWNLDLDASGRPDYLWNFGTTSQYPTLHAPADRPPLPPLMDYDANNNDLIDIASLAQLNAIRWDSDGDGAPDSAAVRPGYDTAFPGRTTTTTNRMGCPNTCAGYELTLPLTFPAETSSPYNPWTPVAAYATEFNGNGHTLTDLNVSVASGHAGLFHSLNSGARIRNVGLIDPEVTSRGVNVQSGALVGRANAGSSIETSYVQGGEIAVGRHAQDVGGLAGYLEGAIRASYATGVVLRTADPCTNCNNIDLGGLVGHLYGNGSIAASYAAATSGNIVSNQSWVGGLVSNGVAVGGFTPQYPTITDSYCDTTAGPDRCVNRTDGVTLTVAGQTTAALQTPTGYEGPYVHWNLDLDASGRPDYLWNFGTTSQYPTLHAPADRPPLPSPMDYDANNNDLIDIDNLAQLNAIRWDLDGDGAPDAAAVRPGYDTAFPGRTTTTTGRMGCPNTCAGYELTLSLTFPAATSSPYNPWTPVDEYAGDFDGRGHTLTNLNVATEDYAGLFGRLNSGGLIRDVGMINPIVTLQGDGTRGVGGLVGTVRSGGQVDTSYVAGGRITLTGGSNRGGGLVGQSAGLIRASYASAEVRTDAARDGVAIGGLVGRLSGGLVASYAYGAVSASGNNINVGGLVGRSTGSNSAITDSYCDTAATMQTACVGPQSGNAVSAQGYLTAALQSPTDYAGGIYVNWNLDLDGNYAPDYPWNFGSSSDYPMLNTPTQRAAAAPPPVDYDQNDNGLIDIRSIAQLHAIRWDANGDGVPESNPAIYSTIFEGRITATSTRMGCPAGNCAGYELAMSLTFPSETTSPYNPWTPIANYAAEFNGQGHTLTGLNIDVTDDYAGLFGLVPSGARIRDVGLINPTVTLTGDTTRGAGTLVATLRSGARVDTSYATGGSVTMAGDRTRGGGLVGANAGLIRASYARVPVRADGSHIEVRIGGLVGQHTGQIIAGYAAGAVTATGTNSNPGGLVGRATGSNVAITNSYCDPDASGQTGCIGSGTTVSAAAVNTAGLQSPAGYTGIYRNWNLDLNGDGVHDYPWDFGAANEYPTLHTPTQRARLIPEPTDYDIDDDNLIDIRSIEQLNAMRYDLNNGDGDPEPANANAYGTAFPGRTTSTPGRMGCLDVCAGYELVADLTFPSETTSPYNPWTPIGGFLDTVLDGKGHSLTNLRVEFNGHAGLFHQIGGVGRVRNLGLVNPSVTSTANGRGAGALAGQADTGSVVEYVYVHGGRIATTGGGGGANTAWVGGLIGEARGIVRASYAGAAVAATQTESVRMGGLVGGLDGAVIESFAYGPVLSTAAQNSRGGLIGSATADGQVINSYCDLTTGLQTACIGPSSPSFSGTADGKTTAELQTPTGYEDSIYQTWNQNLDNDPATDDPVWDFGGRDQYPALWYERRTAPDSPPPGGPRQAQPPQDTPYNPAADHPEIYENPRHEITATCNVQYNADGAPETSAITFNLGTYQGQVILHLAQWNGQYFTSYESLDIPMPTFQRDGQTATVRVTTNPTQTRFLLDSISPTTNLVLGYADCHTDDHTGVLATPGSAAATETPAETPATSTPADATDPTETAATSTPPTPKVYTNDRYEMTASCEVQHNAEGQPESSQITFNLGNYQQTVILSISLWNGEYYASLESHNLPEPTLARDGQTATVLVTTNPAETRFLLDGTPNGLRTNLLLGYADCHTAGE